MSDEHLLERLEREWVDALRRGDTEALDRIWDEGFVFTDPDGQSLSREQCLAAVASGSLTFESAEIRRMQARVFGDTGVVLGCITLHGQAGSRTYNGDYSFVDVYSKRGERWRAVLSSGDRARELLS
jgi:ketosteroid isomerase-like protein